MEIAVGLICVVLFLICRWASRTYGKGAGTLLGLGLLGTIAAGIVALAAVALLLLLLPALFPIVIIGGIGALLMSIFSKRSVK
jgi:hypothetical protein